MRGLWKLPTFVVGFGAFLISCVLVGSLVEGGLGPARDRGFQKIFGQSLAGGFAPGTAEYKKYQQELKLKVAAKLAEIVEQCEQERKLYKQLVSNRDQAVQKPVPVTGEAEVQRYLANIKRINQSMLESGRRLEQTHERCEDAAVQSRGLDSSIANKFTQHF